MRYDLNDQYYFQSIFVGLWIGMLEELTLVLGCVKMLVEVEMEAGVSHAPSSKFCMRNT
jgi:hypothetical protein